MNDPLSDLLTRIRNAQSARLKTVDMPHSKLKESLVAILKKEGYILEYSTNGEVVRRLKLTLKYHQGKGVIEGLKRVSTPGLRRYVASREIPRVLGGLGTSILSTSTGLLTGTEARKNNIGGELLCYVW